MNNKVYFYNNNLWILLLFHKDSISMKILALNPPFLDRFSRESRSPAVAKSGTLYYPMWLAYAVGYLESKNHEVLFLDAPAIGLTSADIIKQTTPFGPQLAIIDTSTPSIYSDIEIAAKLKKSIPNLFVILVGVHVSALPLETLDLNKTIDAVAIGEYDETIVDLADKISSGFNDALLQTIQGIAFRTSAGAIIQNDRRPYIENLDAIPFVSRVYKKHLDISPYFYGHSLHPLVVIMTGRGCPFHCTYCVVPQVLQGHTYRKRSVQNIVEEFKYIHDNFHGVKEIMIEDDTLTADKKRCMELSQALIDNKLNKIPWSANSRADIDYETMRLMKKAGCRLFCVGFESGDQQILNNIKKGTRLDIIQRFVKDAKRAGIMIHGCFMVGNRGETQETLNTTLAFAKKLNPDTAQFFPIMVYPGTSDWEYYKEKNWIVTNNFRDWITEDGLHSSTVSNPSLPYAELVVFCDRARREFYLRPSYIFIKLIQSIRQPSEAKRIFKAFNTFKSYLFK
jgi:radical SAM superfamily enzyme YgiQ (UPF0313 family)